MAQLVINPNTVLKAYRELEHDGLVAARPGVGTFVTATLAGPPPAVVAALRRDLQKWLAKTRLSGLDGSTSPPGAKRHDRGTGGDRAGQTLRPELGVVAVHAEPPRPAGSSGWSARTVPGSRRC
ncbi:hypothetical protein A4R44_01535 [Amycolatopsis sp. M39]|nr:hypothetical protein A4R44_01535 [Amycolatopsis sp. M39]